MSIKYKLIIRTKNNSIKYKNLINNNNNNKMTNNNHNNNNKISNNNIIHNSNNNNNNNNRIKQFINKISQIKLLQICLIQYLI